MNSILSVGSEEDSLINIAENDPYITQKIKLEEQRSKRKIQDAERRAKRKQIELEEQLQRRERALNAMNFLLNKSQLYSKFLGDKLILDLNDNHKADLKKKILKERVYNGNVVASKKKPIAKDNFEQPKLFTGGSLRTYQIEGFTWLKLLFENGINGILADEMGLGKTIQVIALICHLYEKNVNGPHLVIAPLSVITNWMSEFQRFAPKIPLVFFHGDEMERKQKYKEFSKVYKINGKIVSPVVITSYYLAVAERTFLQKFKWSFLILDEAQSIKNHLSLRHRSINKIRSLNRLLLTGTPLQNNLIELWSLLHFLMPNIFGNNSDTFTSVLNLDDFKTVNTTVDNDKLTTIISTIHGVLNPFLLRRLKKDVLWDIVPKKEILVYCPMTEMQRTLCKYVIERNLNLLMRKEEEVIDLNAPRPKRKCTLTPFNYATAFKKFKDEDDDAEIEFLREQYENSAENRALLRKLSTIKGNTSADGIEILKNITMQMPYTSLREVAMHPFLLHMPTVLDEKGNKTIKVDEDLITMSGKMKVLDLLLPRLLADNHKVLLFSCFVMMLDVVEEYLIFRKYKYSRLDGLRGLSNRTEQIQQFKTDPETCIFIITTRAGGLGLNLVEADTVIFYDGDPNPQADIQAQDRCHRIGQTKPVVVYKLLSVGSIDERILDFGEKKKRLEKAVIKTGGLDLSKYIDGTPLNKDELLKLLKTLEKTTNIHPDNKGQVLTNEELDSILDRTELYKEFENQLKTVKQTKKP